MADAALRADLERRAQAGLEAARLVERTLLDVGAALVEARLDVEALAGALRRAVVSRAAR